MKTITVILTIIFLTACETTITTSRVNKNSPNPDALFLVSKIFPVSSMFEESLPNGCVVYAVEATSKLRKSGVSARTLFVDLAGWNHALTIFCKSGKLFSYNSIEGTRCLGAVVSNKSRGALDIAMLVYPRENIRGAWWIEDIPIK